MKDYPRTSYQQAVLAFKRSYVQKVIEAHGGNRTKAAKALGVTRNWVYRLIKDYEVPVPPGDHGIWAK